MTGTCATEPPRISMKQLSSDNSVRFSILRPFRVIGQPGWVLFGRQLRRYDIKKRIDQVPGFGARRPCRSATSRTPRPGSVQKCTVARGAKVHAHTYAYMLWLTVTLWPAYAR